MVRCTSWPVKKEWRTRTRLRVVLFAFVTDDAYIQTAAESIMTPYEQNANYVVLKKMSRNDITQLQRRPLVANLGNV